MVSADVNPWYRERLLETGADDYLTKPLDAPRFLEVVDGLLVPAAAEPGRPPRGVRW